MAILQKLKLTSSGNTGRLKMLRNVVRTELDIKVMPRECQPLKEKSQVTLNCKYWFAVSHEGNSLQGASR